MKALAGDVRRGLRLSLVAQVTAQSIQFPTSLVLARLLSPADFGTIGQIAVFSGIAYFLADLGLGQAIVQRPELDQEELSTLFWVNLALGMALAAFFAVCAPLMGRLYDNEELIPLTAALGSTFIFSSLKVTQYNLLRRRLAYADLAWVDASGHLGASVAAVSLALSGFGVWSLVGMRVARAAVPNLLLYFMTGFRPTRVFKWDRVKDMMRFGGFLLGTSVSNYGSRNFDKFLVGKVFGDGALGLYLRAYEFMMFPLEQISPVVGRVMVPTMSRQQTRPAALQRLLVHGLRRIAFFSAPLMVCAAILSQPLTVTLFGPKWMGAAPLLTILSALGFLQSVSVGVQWIHVALGQGRRLFLIQTSSLALMVVCATIGSHFGFSGVAYGLVAAQVVAFFPSYVLTMRLLDSSIDVVVRPLLGPTLCALLAGAFGYALLGYIEDKAFWIQSIVGCVAMILVYLGLYGIWLQLGGGRHEEESLESLEVLT